MGIVHPRARAARGGQPGDDLADALLRVAEHGQRPPAQHAAHRLAVDVAERVRRGDRRLRPLHDGVRLAPALVHDGHLRARRGQRVGAAGLARELERVRGARERAVGPPEEPQREPRPVVAGDAGVVAERGRERRVGAGRLAALEQRDAALGELERTRERALVEQVAGQQLGRLELVLGVAARHQRQAFLRHLVCARELPAQLVQRGEREQDRHERLVVGQPRGARARLQEGRLGLGRRPAAGGDARLAQRRQQLDLGPQPPGALRQPPRGLQRRLQVADALRVGVAREGPLGGEPEEDDGALGIAAGDEVVRQLGRAVGGVDAVGVGQMGPDAGVQAGPRLGGDQRVEDLAVQVVREGVLPVAALDQPGVAGELVAAGRHDVGRTLERGGERLDRERPAGDARGPEDGGVVLVEPGELVLQVRAQRRRHAGLERRRIAREPDGPARLGERTLGQPVVEQVGHEQRVAARAPREHGGEPVRQRAAGEARGEVGGDGGLVEPRDGEPACSARARRARGRAWRCPARAGRAPRAGTCRARAGAPRRAGAGRRRAGRASGRPPSAGPPARAARAPPRTGRRPPRASRAASARASRPARDGAPSPP